MFSLLLFTSITSSASTTVQPMADHATCTAEQLRHLVSPTGVHQSWPVATKLPASLENELGLLLSDQGVVSDGYNHWLLIDQSTTASYVVQRGGFAGSQTIYGPLPVIACPQVPPDNPLKAKLLRGTA